MNKSYSRGADKPITAANGAGMLGVGEERARAGGVVVCGVAELSVAGRDNSST